jgi:hypothetical protein
MEVNHLKSVECVRDTTRQEAVIVESDVITDEQQKSRGGIVKE